MNRSGIKRGLAISAVTALGVVGVPGVAHAATDVYSISLSPASTSTQAYQTDALNGVYKDNGAAVAGGTVSLTVSETTPASVAHNPLYLEGATVSDTDKTTSADGKTETWTATVDVTSADGTGETTKGAFDADVASSVAGTIAVTAADTTGASAKTSVTVTGTGSTDADDASKVAITSGSSVSVYKGTTDPAEFDLLATDGSNGVFVPKPSLTSSLGGTYAIAAASDTTTPVAIGTWGTTPAFGADPYTTPVDLTSAISGLDAGNYLVEFWVNQDTHASNTNGPDAGEPSAIGSINIVAAPEADLLTSANGGKYDDGFAHYGTATDFTGADDTTNDLLPAGEAASIPLSAQVYDASKSTSDKKVYPAAGTKFAFDVAVDGGTPVRVPASYDASTGLVTASYSVAAADATGDVTASLALSQDSADAGKGTVTSLGTVSSFQDRKTGISQVPGASDTVQATAGTAVSIPVVVVDQFGKPAVGDVLQYTVTGSNGFTTTTTTPATDSTGRTTIAYTNSKTTTASDSDSVTATDQTRSGVTPLAAVTVDYIAGSTAPAAITAGASSTKPTDPYAGTDLDTNGAHKTDLKVAADGNSDAYSFYVVNSKGEALTNVPVTLSATGGEVSYDGKTGSSLSATTDTYGKVTGVKIGSEKLGTVSLTVTAGSASYSFTPLEVTQAEAPYSIVASSGNPASIVPGQSAKFLYVVTDEFGNPVEGAVVSPSKASNTEPGTIDYNQSATESDADGVVAVVVNTVASDSGAGSLVVKPVGVWDPSVGTDGAYVWGNKDEDNATATYTDDKGVTTTYTVEAPAVVVPPVQPAAKISNFWGKSVGNKDVLTVRASHANGKRVNIVRGGKVIAHGAVKGGKVVFRVKDNNGKKFTRYVAKVAKSSKSTRVR